MDFMSKFETRFADKLGEKCTTYYHNDHNCMFDPQTEPNGPFITANWSVFILPQDVEEMSMWAVQHRGNHTVLLHPNSACTYKDHTIWALWAGEKYPVDAQILIDAPPEA